MQEIEQFINEMPILKTLIVFGLGTLIWQGVKVALESYVKSRSINIAADVNLKSEIARLIANEEAKNTIHRLGSEKVLGAMNILRLMSIIDTKISDWQLTCYFRTSDLKDNQTIEDLGRADLKECAETLVKVVAEANAFAILLGMDLYQSVLKWTGLVHDLMFEYESVYVASKQFNENLPPTDGQRITSINNLISERCADKSKAIGLLRQEIISKLEDKISSNMAAKSG